MKKAGAFVLIGAAASLALSLAFAHPGPDRPPGVSTESWIALSPDAGFVVTANSLDPQGRYVHGYLMARRDGKWVRLDPETAGRLTRTE
jgi:hypothetical protein